MIFEWRVLMKYRYCIRIKFELDNEQFRFIESLPQFTSKSSLLIMYKVCVGCAPNCKINLKFEGNENGKCYHKIEFDV